MSYLKPLQALTMETYIVEDGLFGIISSQQSEKLHSQMESFHCITTAWKDSNSQLIQLADSSFFVIRIRGLFSLNDKNLNWISDLL